MKAANIHTQFILTPIFEILKDGVVAIDTIGHGIEIMPMMEYCMQSLFLKMTGAQEQKLKCICWELATNDYEYRYEFINTKDYHECSSYNDKKSVFKDFLELLKSYNNDFHVYNIWEDVTLDANVLTKLRADWEKNERDLRDKEADEAVKKHETDGPSLTEAQKNNIRESVKKTPYDESKYQEYLGEKRKSLFLETLLRECMNLLDSSVLADVYPRKYHDFVNEAAKLFKSDSICCKDLINGNVMTYFKEDVYVHRNRCAHNTTSYQIDYPNLKNIAEERSIDDNYFLRFFMLIVLDEVFIRLYKTYLHIVCC